MKLVIKRVVAAVVFAGILLGVVNAVGFFVRPIDVEADNMSYLYKEDKDTLNVVCLGSSAMYRFWIPQQAYEEQNFTSNLVASSAQNIKAVPYLMEEIEKTQDVDLFIVEIRSPLADEAHRLSGKYKQAKYTSLFSVVPMGMKQSLTRLQMINEVLVEDNENTKLEWMIPILKYHGNINKLTADEFVDRLNGVDKDELYTRIIANVKKQKEPVFEDDPDIVLPECDKQSIDNIEAKAKELGTKVLFISTPYIPNETRAALQVKMGEYINQQGYDFLDMTQKLDEIGLDLNVDFYDKNHVNIAGAQKVTTYMTDYIADHYKFQDRLNSDQKKYWENLCEDWDKEAADLLDQWQTEVEKGVSENNE